MYSIFAEKVLHFRPDSTHTQYVSAAHQLLLTSIYNAYAEMLWKVRKTNGESNFSLMPYTLEWEIYAVYTYTYYLVHIHVDR